MPHNRLLHKYRSLNINVSAIEPVPASAGNRGKILVITGNLPALIDTSAKRNRDSFKRARRTKLALNKGKRIDDQMEVLFDFGGGWKLFGEYLAPRNRSAMSRMFGRI